MVTEAGAADVANVYIAESGGMLKAATNLRMCEAAGITGLIGAMPELGIATAAQIHLGLSATNIHHDCDTCGSLYFDNDCELTRNSLTCHAFVASCSRYLRVNHGRCSLNESGTLGLTDDTLRFLADLVTPLDFSDGIAKPPQGATGLGVEVDMDIVKLWSVPPKNAAAGPKAPPPSRL